MPPSLRSTGLTITNPLVLYRALLSTKTIDPDPAQHRLALKLQELYHRLKDYSPQTEYGARLNAIRKIVQDEPSQDRNREVAVPGHPLRRNPLFAHLFRKKEQQNTLAMTRVLTDHEAAIGLDSPRGLLLHGEVGTGKSMLLDLLADTLPNRKKRRWHFNTFMLETLARLEQLRKSRANTSNGGDDSEHSLLWLAKDMIENSPVLFLDEFQLPDRASSKILSNLLTSFFQLGGVLVASSNRMPDELSKASGMDFTAPPRGGIVRNLLSFGAGAGRVSMGAYPANNEYARFVDVLKARCEIWEMNGGRDWRRREAEEMDEEAAEIAETMREEMIEGFSGLEKLEAGNLRLTHEQSLKDKDSNRILEEPETPSIFKAATPKKYLLASSDNDEAWDSVLHSALPPGTPNPAEWQSTTLLVYGRVVPVPKHLEGVTCWDFEALCGGTFGPADYITLASTFHTLVLYDVPILHLSRKNEARRLITLLDALYEARCKLIIRAESGPDDLFFPEMKVSPSSQGTGTRADEDDGGDAVYPETISEIYQDQTSPFRPNISTYTDEPRRGFDPDEDSDFGPLPGAGNEIGRGVDFGMTSSFTGEDERFAYKRARSRLWEMCGARWHARSGDGWWRPLPVEVRRWERSSPSSPMSSELDSTVTGDVKLGESFELDRPAGLQGKQLEEMERMAGKKKHP
ncbi:Lactation elevated [Hyphodiscus hymeniophilus]|uniref:Lactation elevated n=1 Tax=Hyphodiscus hymeniophilus TaxID=353542 RepID=A0A9P6VE19_9HELO|nr:Lactation elevated [Hyphodiscus hymeniophilus]